VCKAVFALVVAILPSVAFPPAIPFTSQVTVVPGARQKLSAKLCVCPSATLATLGAMVFALVQVIVTLALPNFVASATLVDFTLTVAGEGGVSGARYTAVLAPFAAIVSTVAFPPATPFTLQVTPVAALPVPITFAVSTCAPPVATLIGLGDTLTAMPSIKLTSAEALAVASELLTACTLTLAADGKSIGAVYNPPAEIVPVLAFPCVTLFTSHRTLVSVAPVTVAWNYCVWHRNRLALPGCKLTTTFEGFVEGDPADPHPGSITACAQKSVRRIIETEAPLQK
jgi:hypothetical protein